MSNMTCHGSLIHLVGVDRTRARLGWNLAAGISPWLPLWVCLFSIGNLSVGGVGATRRAPMDRLQAFRDWSIKYSGR